MTWKIDTIKSPFRASYKVQKMENSIHRVIAKQQLKREQTHPVHLHAVEKYEKMESINTPNDYETTSTKMSK